MPDVVVATIAAPTSISVAPGVFVPESGGVPAAHAASHATGGSDPVSPSSIGALSAGEGIAYAIALG